MTTPLSPADVQDTCTVLSSPLLIRLVTEIDDNGPIPQRGLARTLPDLSVYQLRRATDLARTLGLVHVRSGAALDLTTSGAGLADVYDASARWARRHAYPAPVARFTNRIQHTLTLLAQTPQAPSARGPRTSANKPRLSEEALAELARPRDLLGQWLHAQGQAGHSDAA
ncbi:hypothetical protein ABZ820_05070 [Streptomyces diacarni]|uniref:hypothetical protein n=1 Tax=Streptomyces diacarni TaxID=2800381 RepID=UPI0033FFB94E